MSGGAGGGLPASLLQERQRAIIPTHKSTPPTNPSENCEGHSYSLSCKQFLGPFGERQVVEASLYRREGIVTLGRFRCIKKFSYTRDNFSLFLIGFVLLERRFCYMKYVFLFRICFITLKKVSSC